MHYATWEEICVPDGPFEILVPKQPAKKVKAPSRRLQNWVAETKNVNAKLKARGIEPIYRCWIRAGKLVEMRRA